MVLILVLLVVVVTALFADSVGTLLILNRVVRLQHDVCDIHLKVHDWELIVSRQLHGQVPAPLLSTVPGCPYH